MQVHQYTKQLPRFTKAVITIGTFDGVHVGHRQILEQLKQEAALINGETVIITFHPHPRSIVNTSAGEVQLINTIEEKIELLEKEGIDHLVIVPFTEEFSQMSAEEYVESFLIRKFHPHTVIIGYDHRFGNERKGDYRLMELYSKKKLFDLKEIPAQLINNSAISSTRIRKALLAGEVESANALLGYDFFFEGVIIKGSELGRTLGYPTANIQIKDAEKLVPGNGVYAVVANIVGENNNRDLNGMMNIGIRPTIGEMSFMIEVNLFDFNEDIYGETIRVYIKHALRPEQKFNGLDALKEQLAKDKTAALEKLKVKS